MFKRRERGLTFSGTFRIVFRILFSVFFQTILLIDLRNCSGAISFCRRAALSFGDHNCNCDRDFHHEIRCTKRGFPVSLSPCLHQRSSRIGMSLCLFVRLGCTSLFASVSVCLCLQTLCLSVSVCPSVGVSSVDMSACLCVPLLRGAEMTRILSKNNSRILPAPWRVEGG